MAKVTVTITDEEDVAGGNLSIRTVFDPPIQHTEASPAQAYAVELMAIMTSGRLGRARGAWRAVNAKTKPKKKAQK